MIHFFEVKYSIDSIYLKMLWNNTYSVGLCVYREFVGYQLYSEYNIRSFVGSNIRKGGPCPLKNL